MNNLINGDNGYKKLIREKIKDMDIYEEVSFIHNNILKMLNFQEKRILKAFPKLRSLRYNAALQKIRELINKAENSK